MTVLCQQLTVPLQQMTVPPQQMTAPHIAAIWGQMTTGGGFDHLEESIAILGISVMTKQAFIATGEIIGTWWKNVKQESMQTRTRIGHPGK